MEKLERMERVDKKSDKSQHCWLKVSLRLACMLLYAVMVGFNILSSSAGSSSNLFPVDVGGISDFYSVDITPASWVFPLIWTIIFIYQAVWLIYSFACLFRRTEDGSLLYRKYDFFHYGMFIAFAVNNLSIIAWLFLWSNKYLGWALFFIVILTIALHVAIFISVRMIYKYKDELILEKLSKDVWLARILHHNGLAFFVTWVSLASNINFAMFLKYENGADGQLSGTIALIIILLTLITYFVLENFIWPEYLMYLFTPWIVLIIALSGSLAKNWNAASPSRNNVITLILLVIVVLMAISKVIIFTLYKTKCRHRIERKVSPKSIKLNNITSNNF